MELDDRGAIARHNRAMRDAHRAALCLLQDAYRAFGRAASHADPGGDIPPEPLVHRFMNAQEAIAGILQASGFDPVFQPPTEADEGPA